jgi:hypothetical protein
MRDVEQERMMLDSFREIMLKLSCEVNRYCDEEMNDLDFESMNSNLAEAEDLLIKARNQIDVMCGFSGVHSPAPGASKLLQEEGRYLKISYYSDENPQKTIDFAVFIGDEDLKILTEDFDEDGEVIHDSDREELILMFMHEDAPIFHKWRIVERKQS